MTARFARLLLTAAVTTGLVLGLAACGKKGPPRPPEGEEAEYTYPQPYPAPGTVQPGGEEEAGPLSIFRSENRTKTKSY